MIGEVPAWFNPETIIWNKTPGKKGAYRREVALGKAFIDREVGCYIPDVSTPYDAETLWGATKIADEEFKRLKQYDIHVPPVDWYVYQPSRVPYLIAHVAVVLAHPRIRYIPGHEDYTATIAYQNDCSPGLRLFDVRFTQFMYGRIHPDAAAETGADLAQHRYYPDVEPWLRLPLA